MKKMFLASIIIFGFTTVNAQNVTLNVRLQPIQTLVVNEGQQEVNLVYATKANYKNGVSVPNPDHLTIYSTGGFEVKVKSAVAEMQRDTKKMNVNSILINATAGTDGLTAAKYTPNVPLSATETTLVTSTSGGVDKKISIEYKGAGADAYIDNYVAGQNPTTYTTQLTYTIVSK